MTHIFNLLPTVDIRIFGATMALDQEGGNLGAK